MSDFNPHEELDSFATGAYEEYLDRLRDAYRDNNCIRAERKEIEDYLHESAEPSWSFMNYQAAMMYAHINSSDADSRFEDMGGMSSCDDIQGALCLWAHALALVTLEEQLEAAFNDVEDEIERGELRRDNECENQDGNVSSHYDEDGVGICEECYQAMLEEEAEIKGEDMNLTGNEE